MVPAWTLPDIMDIFMEAAPRLKALKVTCSFGNYFSSRNVATTQEYLESTTHHEWGFWASRRSRIYRCLMTTFATSQQEVGDCGYVRIGVPPPEVPVDV
jgi:hypothetical protein